MNQDNQSFLAEKSGQIRFMRQGFHQAKLAFAFHEVPVGAVIVQGGKIIARGRNMTRTWRDPTAHAEIVAIQRASKKIKNERMLNTCLYVTLEPCAMCAGAIIQARIPYVIYGAKDPKAGACGSVLKILPHKKLNHRPKVIGGVMAEECSRILKEFFRRKR